MSLFIAELFLITAMIAFSTPLFIYWGMRAFLLLIGSEEQIARVLDGDMWWGRRFLLTLGIVMSASWQLFARY